MDRIGSLIYADALAAYKAARTDFGRHEAVVKGLRLLETQNYRGGEIDSLAQLVIDTRKIHASMAKR